MKGNSGHVTQFVSANRNEDRSCRETEGIICCLPGLTRVRYKNLRRQVSGASNEANKLSHLTASEDRVMMKIYSPQRENESFKVYQAARSAQAGSRKEVGKEDVGGQFRESVYM